jgi:DNA-binding GntR family transcriptional regulator
MSDPVRKTPRSGSFPIERRNLGSDVYRVLRDRILRQELHAGEKLSDLRLSSELGVSRTPIREALLQLVQDGIVVAEPNRGFFVATIARKDVEEIFDLRAALETFALRQTTHADHTEDYMRALFELEHVERLLRFAENEVQREEAAEAFLKTDRGFHSWLVEKSGNSRLISIITGLWTQIAIFQQVGTELPGWMEIALEQHRTIIQHLLRGDVDRAVLALENHILDMKARVLADLAPPETSSIDEPGGAP